jgi:hypothetical protein
MFRFTSAVSASLVLLEPKPERLLIVLLPELLMDLLLGIVRAHTVDRDNTVNALMLHWLDVEPRIDWLILYRDGFEIYSDRGGTVQDI